MGSDGHNRQPHLPNVISSWFARRDRAHTGRHAAGVAGRRQTAMMSPTARGLTEIDREPPIGVFLFAESYFQAARHLQKEYEMCRVGLRSTPRFTTFTATPLNSR